MLIRLKKMCKVRKYEQIIWEIQFEIVVAFECVLCYTYVTVKCLFGNTSNKFRIFPARDVVASK